MLILWGDFAQAIFHPVIRTQVAIRRLVKVNMPRTYARRLGARKYQYYTPETLQIAVDAVKEGQSIRNAAEAFINPRKTWGTR